MAEAKEKADEAREALGEAAAAIGEAAATAVSAEDALEAAEIRAEAAEDAAEDLAEAVLRTELGRAVETLRTEVAQCHENHASRLATLELKLTEAEAKILTMASEPKTVTTITEPLVPSSTPAKSQEPEVTTTIVEPATPLGAVENIAPVPEKRKAGRWL